VRPSPVLCTRSPTHATVLVTARHATPATCTPRDKQTRFSKRNKGKRKIKQKHPGFEFKPHQVNNSSQSNQGTDNLVSQIIYLILVLHLRLIILFVGGNVFIDSEALLMTDFVNFKIKTAQSFGGTYRGRVCVRVFIRMSAYMCMSICVCTVFLKNRGSRREN
jgi:hypothetical protein